MIEGMVIDVSSNEALVGAAITATETISGVIFSFTTDPTGYYSGTLCPAWYSMTADAPAYLPSPEALVEVTGTLVTQDFALLPAAEVAPQSVQATLATGESMQSGLTINNLDASEAVSFNLIETEAWLATEPISGSIVPSGSQAVTLTLDATGVSAGVYTTSLQVQLGEGQTPLLVVPVTLTVTCTADFSWEPLNPSTGEVVTFTASVAGAEPITLTWDFGDDSQGSGGVVSHAFDAAGEYTVALTVEGCPEGPISVEHTVSVETADWFVFLPVMKRD